MCGKWLLRMIPAILLSCLMLNMFLQPEPGLDVSNGTSITYIGCGVGNLSMEEILASGQNNTTVASFNVTQEECFIPLQEDNILNGTSETNPRDARSEPRSENIMLLFGSLIPIIGMPVLTIINDRHRPMVLKAETLGR